MKILIILSLLATSALASRAKYTNDLKTLPPEALKPPYTDPVTDSEIKETVCWYVNKNIKHPWYEETGPDYVFGTINHKGSHGEIYSREIKEVCQ